MTRGWWRRNIWGLLLVGPLILGILALNTSYIYDVNVRSQPLLPAAVDGTGKATLDDVGVRVVQVKPVTNKIEIEAMTSFHSALPSSVKIWRVIIAVAGPKEHVGSCEIALLDADGRAYEMDPSEVSSRTSGGCSADDAAQPAPYTSTDLFVLPAESAPAAIRITWLTLLPRYILLPVVP